MRVVPCGAMAWYSGRVPKAEDGVSMGFVVAVSLSLNECGVRRAFLVTS